jgi:predicted DNA binding CopG/RHH family protein
MADSKEKLILPDFKDEDEELAFWTEHHVDELRWEPVDHVVWALRHRPKKPVTLRLDESLIDDLKSAAKERGVPYQTLTRGLIRRGLAALRAGQDGSPAKA